MVVRTLAWLLLSVATGRSPVPLSVYSNGGYPTVAEDTLQWRVSDAPELTVNPSLSNAPMVGVDELSVGSAGEIWVSDGALGLVHRFSSDGTLLGSIGGIGDGPGEFRRIGNIFVGPLGEMYVFGARHQRLSRFSAEGDLLADHRLTGINTAIGRVYRLGDGRFIARSRERLAPARVDGLARDTVSYFALSPSGEVGDLLLSVEGRLSTQVMVDGHPMIRDALFSPTAVEAVGGQCLFICQGDRPFVQVLDSRGRTVATITLDIPRRTVLEEDRHRWIEAMLEQEGVDEGSDAARIVQEVGFRTRTPPAMPLVNDLIIDELGFLWVQPYAAPFGEGREWLVLTGEGTAVGMVQMPPRLRVLQVTSNRVIGVRKNEQGEDLIQEYRLNRVGLVAPSDEWPPACRGSAGDAMTVPAGAGRSMATFVPLYPTPN
jgi:hypothetical protein